ncbi:MAG: hypothetical protein EXR44_03205 [Dehalococcoidia bacterium]|nr:hypothetical protein [Dehalococcoidia bacterium]
MNRRLIWRSSAVAAAAVIALFTMVSVALAHESRTLGDYTIEAGFLVEPALEGEPNAALLEIVKTGVAGAGDSPVSGIAANLKVEVTHVSSNTTKVMMLEEGEAPGRYLAYFIPTAPGAYRFHFTGDINGMEFNETFTSGPTTFAEVESARDAQFPVQLASSRETEGALRGTQMDLKDVENTAGSARTIAIIGVVVGVLGLAAGGAGAMLAMRKR